MLLEQMPLRGQLFSAQTVLSVRLPSLNAVIWPIYLSEPSNRRVEYFSFLPGPLDFLAGSDPGTRFDFGPHFGKLRAEIAPGATHLVFKGDRQ